MGINFCFRMVAATCLVRCVTKLIFLCKLEFKGSMTISVNILSARTFKAHCFTYPLRVFTRQIQNSGIDVRILYHPTKSLVECDVLCVGMEFFVKYKKVNKLSPDILGFLQNYRNQVKTLVWFDTTDGTGTTAFDVLPYVDLYAKNQLLRDHQLYGQQFFNNRLWSHFYYEKFGIGANTSEKLRSTVNPQDLHKLAVSWNLGLGDFSSFSKWGRRLRIFWPWANYPVLKTIPIADREVEISFRASTRYKNATISYQREQSRKILAEIARAGQHNIKYEGLLPYQQYKDEMYHSKIVPSPFGLGEVCFRDFECFLAGSVLFKPDMSHLETWPEYYVPEVTYVPHAWDFSDYQDRLVNLLDSPSKCQELAEKGQEVFLLSRSSQGGDSFANHFSSIIQKAMCNSSVKKEVA